ncbi:MAG: hypothetical protein KDK34_11945 [Leptospiraceae bacterium]|nr:hypothetical protein [Leptospiraceae bacterium]MCB1320960.1 hypothetical protein [Leptospiraceae bacterium]
MRLTSNGLPVQFELNHQTNGSVIEPPTINALKAALMVNVSVFENGAYGRGGKECVLR